MRTSISFVTSVLRVCANQYAAAGYQKRRSGIFTVELNPDVLGWVGLNTSMKDGLAINPVIGVRHQRIEAIIADLCRRSPHAYLPPSVSSPLGYLTPERRFLSWSFAPECNIEPLVCEMVNATEQYGKVFMEQHSKLSNFEPYIDRKAGTVPDQMDYRMIIALALCGKRSLADSLVERVTRDLGTRDDPAAEYFKNFAYRFRNCDLGITG